MTFQRYILLVTFAKMYNKPHQLDKKQTNKINLTQTLKSPFLKRQTAKTIMLQYPELYSWLKHGIRFGTAGPLETEQAGFCFSQQGPAPHLTVNDTRPTRSARASAWDDLAFFCNLLERRYPFRDFRNTSINYKTPPLPLWILISAADTWETTI